MGPDGSLAAEAAAGARVALVDAVIITPRTPPLDATGRIAHQEAGFYYLHAPEYHSDPCAKPSLSNSICRILAQESPLHAHHAHPRLNPYWRYGDSSSGEQELGSAIHKLVLGRGAEIARLPFNDYKKNEAKEARMEAALAGLTPLIEKKYAHAESVAEGLRESVSHWLGMPVTLQKDAREADTGTTAGEQTTEEWLDANESGRAA